MTDTVPDHETIEKWVKNQPLEVLRRLPDSTERREAERNIKVAEDLAHRALERVQCDAKRPQS